MTPRNHISFEPMPQLAVVDPALAGAIASGVRKRETPLGADLLAAMEADILACISREISMGIALAKGYARLVETAGAGTLSQYGRRVAEAAVLGPALGKRMAIHLVPVLQANDPALTDRFLATTRHLMKHGVETLSEPLNRLTHLIACKDLGSAIAFLDLLDAAFSSRLSHGRARHLAYSLPVAVGAFAPARRPYQIRQLGRLMTRAPDLADAFLEGMERGLSHLSETALEQFVASGLAKAGAGTDAGRHFFSVSSVMARETLQALQTEVPLEQARTSLERYLKARTGRGIGVRPLSQLPDAGAHRDATNHQVCTDGHALFLPDVMDRFPNREENHHRYQVLAKLESACFEFGTFDFDLEKLRDRHPGLSEEPSATTAGTPDLSRFFRLFDNPLLAADLFTIVEHGRLWHRSGARYPGLARRLKNDLVSEMVRLLGAAAPGDPRPGLYAAAAGLPLPPWNPSPSSHPAVTALRRMLQTTVALLTDVHDSGCLVADAYPLMARSVPEPLSHAPMQTPFGRKIRPALLRNTWRPLDRLVEKVRHLLEQAGEKGYAADIRHQLQQRDLQLGPEDLKTIIAKGRSFRRRETTVSDTLCREIVRRLPEDIGRPGADGGAGDDTPAAAFWYREWHQQLNDYVERHVRVRPRTLPPGDLGLWDRTLADHRGAVRRIRRAFGLLKPQGLVLLRHWPDGDAFDYRALVDAAVDIKSGQIPSDRLYLKRLKQARDVAVLLLVDLSGSTGNAVNGSGKPVLQVEQEAIVLLCEALEMVGDRYAIAGFSGHSRHQVDYFRFKEFDDPLTDTVRGRICGMHPQRSTRTGAAIRHGIQALSAQPSKIRLLVLLGDGYPNDIGYKGEAAVADVLKAMGEAAAANVHVRPITVHLASGEDTQDRYGCLHHNIISDARELPDLLWRIYGRLTG